MSAGLIAACALGGLVALYFGAHWLVGAASDIARRLGVAPLLIGLTVVAIGTSLPELFVSVAAALRGHSGVSVGNVIGANALNLGFILGIAALIRPVEVGLRVLRWDMPVLFAASALLAWFASDGVIGRGEGALLLAAMLAYLGLNVALGRRERRESALAGAVPGGHGASLALDAVRGAAGAAALAVGARLLLEGALGGALSLGVSETAVGLTLVAVATTLPELVTTLVAAARRQGDIAFGNVIGSNINNTLAVVGATAAAAPLDAAGAGRPLYAMLVLTLLAAPVMWRGFVVSRAEGALLVCGYAGFLWFALAA